MNDNVIDTIIEELNYVKDLAWRLCILERDICLCQDKDEKMSLLKSYNSLSNKLFGEVRLDRELD